MLFILKTNIHKHQEDFPKFDNIYLDLFKSLIFAQKVWYLFRISNFIPSCSTIFKNISDAQRMKPGNLGVQLSILKNSENNDPQKINGGMFLDNIRKIKDIQTMKNGNSSLLSKIYKHRYHPLWQYLDVKDTFPLVLHF